MVKNTIEQIKRTRSKFVRYKEGCELYSMGRDKFMKLAKEAGATYKIDKLVLVNTEILDKYLESFRVPGESY